MRVLALVPGDIGNQILFFPTLETIKKQYPQAAIDVLVEPRSKKAYRVCKNVDDVLVFDFQDRNSFADYLNLLGTVRDREYDALISLKTSWRIKLLLWLNGIPTRVGYQDDSALYLSKAIARKSEQYRAEMYHDLVRGLDIEAPCPSITINVPKEDISWAESEQQRRGMEGGYIVLNDEPEDASAISSYPLDRWQKIIADIEQRQTGLAIVLFQTSQNQEWVSELVSANGNLKAICPSDAGKAAALVAGSNLVLSSSNIAIQLAIATGAYTFAMVSDQNRNLVPSRENCTIISSSTDKLEDIQAETVIQKLWQE